MSSRSLMRKKYRRRDVARALVPPLLAARMLAVDEEARAQARLNALMEARAGLDEIEVAVLALRDVQAGMKGLEERWYNWLDCCE